MDPRRNLLKNSWITLLAAFAVVMVLALLPNRAGAMGIEHTAVDASLHSERG
jgi:hypothetical protein